MQKIPAHIFYATVGVSIITGSVYLGQNDFQSLIESSFGRATLSAGLTSLGLLVAAATFDYIPNSIKRGF